MIDYFTILDVSLHSDDEVKRRIENRRKELSELKLPDLKKLCGGLFQKTTGNKDGIIERIIKSEGYYIDDKTSYLNKIMERSQDMSLSPNEIFRHTFNGDDGINRGVEVDIAHDKTNDWRSRFLWDIIQIGIENAYALYCENEDFDFFTFCEKLSESLLIQSTSL